MNIKFNHIKISNFLSLGNVQLELNNRGFVLIEGVNLNPTDKAKSNGSGKSSIFEAIVWALTGQTIRGTKDVVNRFGDDGICVELYFVVDKDTYNVTRFKDHSKFGTNLKILKNGHDISGKGIRDSESILQEHLPDIDAQLLGSVIVLGQGLPQRFTNNTPSGRKEILEKLSKSDFMIEDVKNRLNERKTILSSKLRKEEDNILTINAKTKINEEIVLDAEEKLVRLENTSTQQIREQQKLDLQKLSKTQNELGLIEENLRLNEESLKNIRNSFVEEKQLLESNLRLKTEPLSNEIREVELEVYKIESLVVSKSREKYKLENIETNCPTCGRPYDDIHKPDTAEINNEILQLKDRLNILTNSLNELKLQQKENQQRGDSELKQVNIKYSDLISEYEQSIRKDREDFRLGSQEIQQLNLAIQKVEIELAKYDTEISSLKSIKIKALEDNKDMAANLENHLEVKLELDKRLEAINKLLTMAQRDFRTYVLEDIVGFINQRANIYSRKLFVGKTIAFKGENNQIWIGIDGKAYEGLSGGEKQKVDLIIQFSLRDMLVNLLNFSSNILVLDEIFDNLDSLGSSSLVELILEELADVESIFIITHHSDISIPYDDKILICKEESGSSVLR